MATLDDERGVVVVRVVYDGPPFSGKTTTLRSLARGLGVEMTSPEESGGRTLFFDWVEYVGGLYEGRQIHCQIVSVPGQYELAHRRRALLESADAIVMVADTRESEISHAFEHLRGLLPWCRSQEPPIGVVVQANKRDAPDGVPRARIHEEVNSIGPIAIIDTVATNGEGVREAFVFSVRLALDRVRGLGATGLLPRGAPRVATAEQLLQELSPTPGPPVTPSEPPPSLTQGLLPELPPEPEANPCAPTVPEQPFVPDPLMPGGFIWPPVDGRMLLHEVAQLALAPSLTPSGDWWAAGNGWRFHSAARSVFSNADLGRRGLIEWARMHAINLPAISTGRTVILADAGAGRFRLWQLLRSAPSVRERLTELVESADTNELATALLDAAAHLLRARTILHRAGVCLPCTLWTISGDPLRQPTFVGLMPSPVDRLAEELNGQELIEREFTHLLAHLAAVRPDRGEIAAAMGRSTTTRDVALDTLSRLATQSAVTQNTAAQNTARWSS